VDTCRVLSLGAAGFVPFRGGALVFFVGRGDGAGGGGVVATGSTGSGVALSAGALGAGTSGGAPARPAGPAPHAPTASIAAVMVSAAHHVLVTVIMT
jgi:hypothetical protein